MAEVFLAKSTGAEGIEKVLVVKRVLPSFARSAKFISMFVDEAKVAMRLNHPNIVQVYAFEEVEKQFLLAMEFVDGLDLGRLVNAARRLKRRVPYGLAAYAVMEVAKGLDYAHKRKDASGVPMEIVHRDVSPQNVLLTYDGVVKVADFGIAKAKMVSEETGVIKGKFAYMSPEQARGQRVDHRSDVYSLGVLLAELLMNRSMYPGEHGLDVLEKVREGQLDLPQTVDSNVPDALNVIVRRATSKDREERYQTGRALAGSLAQYLHSLDHVWDGASLESFIGEVAPRVRTTPEGGGRANLPATGRDSGFTGAGSKERRERRRVVVVSGCFRRDTSSGRQAEEAVVTEEIAKVFGDIAFKADAVLSWPDGLGRNRFRFIVGLGKASVTDPLKAARLANDTVEALDGLSADMLAPVSASLGMSRGLVLTVRDGSGRLLRYSPVGRVIDVAERLAASGGRRDILAAGEVFRLVRRDFGFDPDPIEVDVKTGVSDQRLSAWQLRGALTRKERRENAQRQGLVGRGEELETINGLYEEVREANKAQFVALTGPLGVGKTALVAAALEGLEPKPRILHVECAYGTADVPYAAAAELLRGALDIPDRSEGALAQLQTGLERLITRREVREACLAALSPLLGGTAEPAHGEGDRVGLVRTAVEAIVKALASQGPLVIWVDGLQWADLPSLDLISSMHQRGYDVPCLVLLSTRPDDRLEPMLRAIPSVEIPPLPIAARAALVHARFEAEAGVDILTAIENRAGGNPFFIVELVDALVERRAVAFEGEGTARRVKRRPGTSIQLPTTLEGAIAARLDELSEDERHALRWMAVAGAGLLVEDLNAISETDLGPALASLQQRGLLARRPVGFGFPSAVVRQVAYEATDLDDRLRMHRRIALHLQQLHRAVAPGRIARHLEQAGAQPEAAKAYLEAAEAARSVYSNREALRFYGRALQLLAPDDIQGRLRGHQGRSEILRFLGRQHEQLRELEAFRTLAQREGSVKRRAEALLSLTRFELDNSRFAGADDLLTEAQEAARASGAPELQVEGLLLEMEIARNRGEPDRALTASDRALELAGLERQMLALRAKVLVQRGIILRRLGDYSEAFDTYAEAIVIFRRLGMRRSEAFALNSLGVALIMVGQYEDAITAIRASVHLDRQTGDRLRLGRKLSNIGQLYDALGDAERGLSFMRRSLDIFEAVDDRGGRCDALAALAEMMIEAGHDTASVSMPLDQARRIAERLESAYDLARERIVRSQLARAAGQLDLAREAAQEAIATARQSGLVSYETHGLVQLSVALADVGSREAALDAARQARSRLGVVDVERAERLLLLLGTVFDTAGHDEEAQGCFTAAADLLSQKSNLIRSDELRERYLTSPDARKIYGRVGKPAPPAS